MVSINNGPLFSCSLQNTIQLLTVLSFFSLMDGLFFEAVLISLFILAAFVLISNHYSPLFILNFKDLPRGSFGWPLIGQTLNFLSPHNSGNLGTFLEDHISRYGRVFRSHLFCTPTIVSCDQELNHFILQNEEKFFQCCYPKPIHGILGNSSMIVVVGDTHRRLRNLAVVLLTTIKSSPTYLSDIEEIAVHILDSWKDDQTVFFCKEAKKFTFSVIVKQVLGLSQDDLESAKILEDFQTFMKGLISLPLHMPGSHYAKAVKARARISSTVKAMIEKRRGNGKDCKKKGGFLDVLLSTNNLSEDEKVSFVLDTLLGGYETTSLLISMAVYFLHQYPSSFKKLKSEHQSIRTSKKKEECLHLNDYKKMYFTQNVINEALRCGNIVKFVHRKALKDVMFKGHLIPCGWKILPILSAVHLDSTLHPNPLHFDPFRWEGQKNDTNKKLTPFGGGTRLCPGSELAKVEAAIFIHHLVLKFRWRLDEEDSPIAYPYVEFPRGLPLQVEKI